MLGGLEIKRLVESGEIDIDPFDEDQLNPNSYNCRLFPKLLTYKLPYQDCTCLLSGSPDSLYGLDMAVKPEIIPWDMPDGGFWLMPNTLYLGATDEVFNSGNYIPLIETRSGMARLGLSCHLSAGFGDVGFKNGSFTLEITVVHPLKIYPGVQICQIAFQRPEGAFKPYQGKYQGQRGPVPSQVWKEFLK